MEFSYIPKDQRKKILFLCDDIRTTSGIATIAREIVVNTANHFNWVTVGAALNHPEANKKVDLSDDTNKTIGIQDASVLIYAYNGYGDPGLIRFLLEHEKPDAILFFTDPRYWIWLFQIENEIRTKIPMIYLNIWDDLPAPLYNESYYDSCDALMAISKQTLNINKMVLGEKAKNKILKYVPHGINESHFFPITPDHTLYKPFLEYKKQVLGDNDYEFVVFYNARNLRRKSTSDLVAAYREFCVKIGKEKASKCALLMHTQPIDDNGTDLHAVVDLLSVEGMNVHFTGGILSVQQINMLYNMGDVTALISSNEGWGLSLTESLLTGRMIIANVTGGMQDQMRFENEKGEWIDFDADFCSNHFGTYNKHGEWARPVFPTNISMVGSPLTPYIWDDRCDFREVATAIHDVYLLSPEERKEKGLKGREWATGDEACFTVRKMNESVVDVLNTTMNTFKPRPHFELIKIDKQQPKKQIRHKLIY
jgi:hypothetical protein